MPAATTNQARITAMMGALVAEARRRASMPNL
jgi:hypothetical protein